MTGVRVHVSRVDGAGGARNSHLLSSVEQQQAERFVRESDRALFSNGRIQRRVVLGRYLNADPASLIFATGQHGKPGLASPHPHAINFNTSHSEGVNVIAVVSGSAVAVGIDLERLDRPVPDFLWRTCLSPSEAHWMTAAQAPLRSAHFMRLWTCKEAVMKATGLGLGIDPASIDIDPETFEIRSLPDNLGDRQDYRLAVRDIMNGFSLAACIIGASTESLEIEIVDDPP